MSVMKVFTAVSSDGQELGPIYLNPARIVWAVESGTKQIGKTILHLPAEKIAVAESLSSVIALFPNKLSFEIPAEPSRGVYIGINGIVNLDAITSLDPARSQNGRSDEEWIRVKLIASEDTWLGVQVHVSQWKHFLRDDAR